LYDESSRPASTVARTCNEVRARYPDAYVFGEMIHGDDVGFVRETGVDAVTQYELWKAIMMSCGPMSCTAGGSDCRHECRI
jgi:hypothetical protein